MRDLGGPEPGGGALVAGKPGVERGDKPVPGSCEGGRQPVQIVRPDMQVAIRDHQHLVPRGPEHVDEVAHLAVRAMQVGSTTTATSQSGKRACNRRTASSAGIGRVLHAEDELIQRVMLPEKRGERLFQHGLRAIERLQNA